MTFTPVKADQWTRSAKAHRVAESQFYPRMWRPEAQLAFTDLTGTRLDTEMAIDYLVEVRLPGWGAPVKFWIQERWRDPSFYWTFRDVTITAWNRNSDLPAELCHFGAGIFVYGYYDETRDQISAAFAYSSKLIYLLTTGRLAKHPCPPNDRNQEVIGIDRRDLWEAGCLLCHYKSRELDGTFRGKAQAEAAPRPPEGGVTHALGQV
jgi:hypothetical protein